MKFSTLFLVTLTTVATATPIISLELEERQIMTDNPTDICDACIILVNLYIKVNLCSPREVQKQEGACWDKSVCKAVKKSLLCKGACGFPCQELSHQVPIVIIIMHRFASLTALFFLIFTTIVVAHPLAATPPLGQPIPNPPSFPPIYYKETVVPVPRHEAHMCKYRVKYC
ncbi:hypothetical protein BKA58DRAFT_397327 [Alternaria rosae]|uniref:uncharacterized protein n=1 Tax=Alternaria rosae TaxID=1187941 RepID=UPI001E8CF119|nr:uncharacterized protein BKA58DRAFT_397327 [Alternaria rosae]KAH6883113.1 hypothetical protein BKA58DRAFT_397327 [Alternaria rosae]